MVQEKEFEGTEILPRLAEATRDKGDADAEMCEGYEEGTAEPSWVEKEGVPELLAPSLLKDKALGIGLPIGGDTDDCNRRVELEGVVLLLGVTEEDFLNVER